MKTEEENKYLFLLDELILVELNSMLKSNIFTKDEEQLFKRLLLLKTIDDYYY